MRIDTMGGHDVKDKRSHEMTTAETIGNNENCARVQLHMEQATWGGFYMATHTEVKQKSRPK